jgi:hypothetical protein
MKINPPQIGVEPREPKMAHEIEQAKTPEEQRQTTGKKAPSTKLQTPGKLQAPSTNKSRSATVPGRSNI